MAIINDFPVLSSPATGDEIPIERGVTTYKIDYNTLAEAIIAKIGDPVLVSHGGTGLTSAPSMLVNLASTQADSPLSASPRPGVVNTLGVDNGGTGAATAQAARENLGAAASLFLEGTDWSSLYAELTAIPTNYSAVFKSNGTTTGVLTGSKVTSIVSGVVSCLTATIFEFMAHQANSAYVLVWRVTFASGGASATVSDVYRMTGNAI